MDSNTSIISLIYYVGIASCAAQGAEKGRFNNSIRIPVLHYIANAFGGGVLRDVIFLGMYPWLLTSSALPDLALVVVTGFLYTYYFFIRRADKKQYGIAMCIVSITDAFGLGSFICIGMDKAFIYSNDVFIIILCGYVTAIGGGVLASEKPLMKIFNSRKTVCYHLVTLLGCCYYYIFRHSLCLVYFIATGLFLVDIDYRTLHNPYYCNLTTLCPEIFLLYPAICNKNNIFVYQKITKIEKKFSSYLRHQKIYLEQQRIRQC